MTKLFTRLALKIHRNSNIMFINHNILSQLINPLKDHVGRPALSDYSFLITMKVLNKDNKVILITPFLYINKVDMEPFYDLVCKILYGKNLSEYKKIYFILFKFSAPISHLDRKESYEKLFPFPNTMNLNDWTLKHQFLTFVERKISYSQGWVMYYTRYFDQRTGQYIDIMDMREDVESMDCFIRFYDNNFIQYFNGNVVKHYVFKSDSINPFLINKH